MKGTRTPQFVGLGEVEGVLLLMERRKWMKKERF